MVIKQGKRSGTPRTQSCFTVEKGNAVFVQGRAKGRRGGTQPIAILKEGGYRGGGHVQSPRFAVKGRKEPRARDKGITPEKKGEERRRRKLLNLLIPWGGEKSLQGGEARGEKRPSPNRKSAKFISHHSYPEKKGFTFHSFRKPWCQERSPGEEKKNLRVNLHNREKKEYFLV